MPFQLVRAQNLMRASWQAYGNTPSVAGISLYGQPLTQASVSTFTSRAQPIADTEGFVASTASGDILVAFRGSEDPGRRSAPTGGLIDWIVTDALAVKLPYPLPTSPVNPRTLGSIANIVSQVARLPAPAPRRLVHAGFLIAYLAALRVVRRRVAAAMAALPRARRIVVTGHSLGGAIAVHAAVDLANLYRTMPVHCYTFGAPRTGNSDWEFYAMNRLGDFYHVVNYRDPVALVPPLGPKTGTRRKRFNREAETWYIDRRGRLRPNIPLGTSATAFNFRNHLPDRYDAALRPPAVTFDRRPRSTRMK